VAEITPDSTIRQVLDLGPEGRQLLFEHGYDVGEGFQDVLSHYQSLRDAARAGRIRELDRLLAKLNSAVAKPSSG
jgi:hypothetical protein